MIDIRIYKSANSSQIRGFRLSGHADFSKSGTDIVCAAVSVLAINAINSISLFASDEINVLNDEENAVLECVFPNANKTEISNEASILLNSMVLGFRAIEEQYGEAKGERRKSYIKISEEAPK